MSVLAIPISICNNELKMVTLIVLKGVDLQTHVVCCKLFPPFDLWLLLSLREKLAFFVDGLSKIIVLPLKPLSLMFVLLKKIREQHIVVAERDQ